MTEEDPTIAARTRQVMEEIRACSPGARLAEVPTLFAFGPIYRAIEELRASAQPRCETCAHFERDDAYVEPAGRCNEKTSIWSDCNDYTIYVSADFGCIKWKERA